MGSSLRRPGHSPHGAREAVNCIAWSPDGLLLASGAWDRTISIWAPRTGVELAQYDFPEGGAVCVAWSPDGALLASCHERGIFRLWDASASWDTADLMPRRAPAAASPAAAIVAGGGAVIARTVPASPAPGWSGAEGTCLGRVEHDRDEHGNAGAVAFSADGRTVFLGGPGGAVRALSVASGEVVWERAGVHGQTINSMALAPDGRSLVSAGGALNILRSEDGQPISQVAWSDGGATAVCWSPDGLCVAAALFDGSVRVLDAMAGREVLAMRARAPAHGVAWSSDGAFIASGHGLASEDIAGTVVRRDDYSVIL